MKALHSRLRSSGKKLVKFCRNKFKENQNKTIVLSKLLKRIL